MDVHKKAHDGSSIALVVYISKQFKVNDIFHNHDCYVKFISLKSVMCCDIRVGRRVDGTRAQQPFMSSLK